MEASHSDQGFGSPKIKKSTDGTPKKKRGKKEGEVSPPPEADAHPEVAAEGKGGRVLAKSKEAEESEKIPEVQVSEAKVDLKAELKKEASKERREEPKPMEQPIVQPKAEPKEPKVEPKEEPKEEPKVEPKEEPKVEPKEEPKQEPKVEPKEEPKAEPTAEPKAEPKEEPKVEPKEEPKEKPIEEAKKEEPKEDSSTTKSSPSTPDEVAVSKPSASSPFLTLKSLHPSQPSLHPSQPSQSSQPSPRTQISGFPRPQSPKVITTKPSPFAGRPPPALPLQDVKPLPSTSSFRQRLLFYQHLESNNAEEKDKESKEKKPGASTIGRKTEIHVEKESSEDEESSDEGLYFFKSVRSFDILYIWYILVHFYALLIVVDIKVIDEEIKRTAKKLSSLMEHRKSISVPANFSPGNIFGSLQPFAFTSPL
jgi:hypothetical protein